MKNKEIQSINTIKELEDYRHKINEEIDSRKEFITLCEIADKASKKSFGYIKESFENIAPTLFKTKIGQDILKKYSKTIKENNNLKQLHVIYENVRKIDKTSNIDFFINNIANENWGVNNKTITEDTLKLGKVLAEGIILSGLKPEFFLNENKIEEKEDLDSAIKYISENTKNSKNIFEYSKATQILKEHASKNTYSNNIIKNNMINLDDFIVNEIAKFSSNYENLLTENDLEIIKEINNTSNKENLFNTYKNNCIKRLSEAKNDFSQKGDSESLNRLNSVIEKVSKKTFVSENIITDLCSFMDLTKLFD